MPKKKVLLLGSYGQTNLGDDLLMWNYLAFLRKQGFTQILVNANNEALIPDVIRRAYPDMQVIETYRTGMLGWLRILRRVDYVVYGGGTIYKELYASTGRSKHAVTLRMAVLNWLARLMGTKIYHLNIGIGSIKTWAGRAIAKIGLGAAAYTTFRDQLSYEYARHTLHLPPKRICQSTDGLFLDERWKKAWHVAPLNIDKKYKTVIGINLLSDIPDWVDRTHYIATARKLVRQLCEAGHFVVLMPFQHESSPTNDHVFMQKEIVPYLKKQRGWRLLEYTGIDQIGSLLDQCDAFIGMRFHSLLLATVTKTPFVAINYDTKCTRFIEETGYPHAVKLEELTLAAVEESLREVLKEKSDIKKLLGKITAAQYKQAEECLRKVKF